jgi:putative Holliday junction resolvase
MKLQVERRILGIDPGDRRIGVAVSDPGGMFARPLLVFEHKSRALDAARICDIAIEQGAILVVVGAAMAPDGEETASSRKSSRIAEEIRSKTEIPVILWDESGSTLEAKQIKRTVGVSKKKRKGHQDATAAAVILQDYLDSSTHKNHIGDLTP